MPKAQRDLPLLELLYEALRCDIGLKISTNDTAKLRTKLYSIRKEAADPQLEVLVLTPSPSDPNELWIIKKGQRNASEEQ